MFKAYKERLGAEARARGLAEPQIAECSRYAWAAVKPFILSIALGAAGILVGLLVTLLL